MRIAMVSEHASPLAQLGGPDAGGQNVYVARLSRALAARGHQVTVYTRKDAPHLPTRVPAAPGVTVEHVPAGPAEALPKDALYAHMGEFGTRLQASWTRERPDIVHSHFWMSGLAALRGAARSDIPVVHTYHALGVVKRRHQGRQDTSPRERIEEERRIGCTCTAVLATCTDEVRELGLMGVPSHRTTVVPCGVDPEHFTPAGGDGTGIPSASPGTAGRVPARRRPHRLLGIGRLVPRKGFEYAVRALAQLPDTELLIAGGPEPEGLESDPEALRLRKIAADAGVAGRVRLLGGVPSEDMPELIRSADLVLNTPLYEPFGIAPLEAMACGVPVLATRVGGHLDSIEDHVTGHLVDPGDPGQIARTAGRLLARPDRLRALGRAARARVLDRFTWERVADGVEDVYRLHTAGVLSKEVVR